MKPWTKWVAIAVTGTALALPALGEDTEVAITPSDATEAPAAVTEVETPAKEQKPKTIRLVTPWKYITTLTDEQKQAIAARRVQFLADQRRLRQQEEDDIKAMLTPEQREELAAYLEREAAERKAKAAAREKKSEAEATETPATQPVE